MPFSAPVSVVDIGSNSVRLVIYDGLKRAPMPVFNEKLLCGLAKNMEKTGKLNPQGVDMAYAAIRRFVALSDVMNAKSLNMFATSAVRDAKDGMKFVEKLQKSFGVEVGIFSGEKEAEYAGLGVTSSISKVNGIVGDLGGGSFELIGVKNGTPDQEGCSFPIGPLRAPLKKDRKTIGKFIDKYLDKFPLKEKLEGESFYAVGGALRNLAKVHMGRKNYPLKVIHNYKISADDFISTLQIVSRMSETSLARLPGVPRKRLNFLPYAAMLLEKIIEKGQPKHVVFSATGVREGFLFSKINNDVKKQDPLISGSTEIMTRMLREPTYGYELAEWMSPLFKNDSEDQKRLRLAACIMSEISCYENTEYRAELAYRKILDSSLTGLSHKDRVFIAKSLYCRYSTLPDEHILSVMQPLLSSKKIQDAQIIGSAMRLGRSLSCSHSGVLKNTKLQVTKNKLKLQLKNKDLHGASVLKRMNQLSDIMGLKSEVV